MKFHANQGSGEFHAPIGRLVQAPAQKTKNRMTVRLKSGGKAFDLSDDAIAKTYCDFGSVSK